MSNPFVTGKNPRTNTIEQLVEWLDDLGLRIYGNMVHEDGSETGLHDFDAEMVTKLLKNLDALNGDEDKQQ